MVTNSEVPIHLQRLSTSQRTNETATLCTDGEMKHGCSSACWETERALLISERDAALHEAAECREQLDALIEAVRILTRKITTHPQGASSVAAVELTPPPTPVDDDASHSPRTVVVDRITPKSPLRECAKDEDDRLLEELQSSWKLEDTGFISLSNACRQVRDSLLLTSMEADDSLHDVHAAHAATAAAQAKCRKLDHAVRKLWKENASLKKELETRQRERKKLVKEVRRYVRDLNERQERRVHEAEALLVHETVLLSTGDGAASVLGADESEEMRTPPSPPTSPSESSLVTEEGEPTIRLAPRMSFPNSPNQRAGGRRRGGRQYCITFESADIGLQMQGVPIDIREIDVRRSEASGRPLVDLNEEKADKEKNRLALTAFLVCGFQGFDSSCNNRPTIGARVVAVNGTSLERGQWTIEGVWEVINASAGAVSMSFRNDILTRQQMAILQKAVVATADVR